MCRIFFDRLVETSKTCEKFKLGQRQRQMHFRIKQKVEEEEEEEERGGGNRKREQPEGLIRPF